MAIPLTAITRIEQALVDRLLDSTELPPNVLVQRLADSIESTGTITNSSTITIRYTGQSASLKNRSPLVTENTLSFEVEVSTQQYFTHNGHDAALRLVAAVKNSLTNFMPMNTGIMLEHPMNFTSESFSGITENTEFVYKLSFNTVAQFTWPLVATDACVQRGISQAVWPGDSVSIDVPLRGVVDPLTRDIYIITDDDFSGTKFTLVSTEPPIARNEDGETTTAVEPTNKKLFEYGFSFYRSSDSSSAKFYEKVYRGSQWSLAKATTTVVAYIDPLFSDEIWKTYSQGTIFKVSRSVKIEVDSVEYTLAQFEDSPKIWIEDDKFI